MWFWMLCHEMLRNDVVIRAQSLAFLMVFSLLPLIAGVFFIFTFLAQFGMVQDALTNMTQNFLSTIPDVHRQFIADYIIQFKDAYLAGITKASRSVGIFALFILGWVGLQAFINIDSTLNFIWSAERSRPLHETIRNFIVVSVLAPLVLVCGFSIPILLQRFHKIGVLLNTVLPLLLLMGTFLLMYRYVPVRRVWWRSAFWGALFATVSMGLSNALMRVYFLVGTNSAYGKAAAVPLIGFWIYLFWIVVILGAEVSFLCQNSRDIFRTLDREPSLREGHGLLACLAELYHAYQGGRGPVSFERLRDCSDLDSAHMGHVLKYLLDHQLAVECVGRTEDSGTEYTLARDIGALSLSGLLQDYFRMRPSSNPVLDTLWADSLQHWTAFFEKTRVADLAKDPPLR